MDYHSLVEDFARRTRSNLEALHRLQQNGTEVFEVTALVNSMLGLLVFPQQAYVDQLPEVSLEELAREGWPMPRVVCQTKEVANLRQLVRVLRNAISHFNIEFDSDNAGQLAGLTVWNTDPLSKQVTWKAEISIVELKCFAMQFVALLLSESQLAKRYPVSRP